MRSPAPTPRLRGGGSGAQRMPTDPAQIPSCSKDAGSRDPAPETSPIKTPPQPEPGEGRGGSDASSGEYLGRGRVTTRVPIIETFPCPLTEREGAANPVVATGN